MSINEAGSSASGGAQTVSRGLRAIRLLGDSVDGRTAQELAQALNVNLSATYRLLRSLVEYGFVRRDADGRYRLGVLFITLAEQTRFGIRSVALPVLTEVVEKTGCSAMLLAADGDEAVVLAAVEPSVVAYRVRFLEGQRHPLTRGAAAYAILAARPPGSTEPEPVRQARELGYAVSHGEIVPGAYGLAIALDREAVGIEVCLNLSSPSEERLGAAETAARDAVKRLNEALNAATWSD